MIGKGGIVRDKAAHRRAIESVLECGKSVGLLPVGLIPSPIFGGDGNREFLVWFTKDQTKKKEVTSEDIRRVAE
jgi:23S rRNA (cytidine1920-2'-O)/16S rRNA (cytidine1409-2'-O)-methyltransferase